MYHQIHRGRLIPVLIEDRGEIFGWEIRDIEGVDDVHRLDHGGFVMGPSMGQSEIYGRNEG